MGRSTKPKPGERWQPGEHEIVSCKAKLYYSSAMAAGKAKDHIKRSSGPVAKSLNIYRCAYCDGWHLGRPRKPAKAHHRRKQVDVD